MMNITFLLMVAFMLATFTLLIQTTHFLLSLFCLEAMMLSSMMMVCMIVSSALMLTPFMSMIILTFGACEASLGLSLMVCMSRKAGSDMINSMTTNKC